MKNNISKIIVIVDSIDINDSSGSKMNVALIENLNHSGYEVTVYHYTHKNIQLENIKCISIKEIKWSANYILSRTQRLLFRHLKIEVSTFLENKFGFSFTFFNDVNSIKRAFAEIKKQNPDLIITLSKGTSFRPHYALLSCSELHHKWIANVHDPFPFHYAPSPYNWIEPGYDKKEKFFLEVSEKAQYSSFPSLLLKEWMGSYFPNFLKTGIVIPHQNTAHKPQNIKLPEYFDESKFNLLHAGHLMKQRSPEGLIEGFKLFLKQKPEARKQSKLILLGHAAEYHTAMLEYYKKENPEIYIYNEYVDFDVIYTLQKKITVNIILESKAEISPFLPGKFPHCVEANKPILSLSPYYSEVRRLLGNDYPYWSEVDDVEKIAGIFQGLFELWQENPENLILNRGDLLDYLSVPYLKQVISNIK
ncbi:MAG: UDP-glycosyltransferase [Bacteroidota bacterium]